MNPNYWRLMAAREERVRFLRGVAPVDGTTPMSMQSGLTELSNHKEEEIGRACVVGDPGGDERVGRRWI